MHAKLIYYEWSDNRWTKKRTEIGTKRLFERGRPKTIEHRTINEMLSETKHLRFEANGKPWYKQENYSDLKKDSISGRSNTGEALYEVWKDHKSGSWIWIEDDNLKGKIPIWDGLSYAFQDESEFKWTDACESGYFPKSTENAQQPILMASWYQKTFESMQSQGKWIETEKFCNRGYERNISKDDLENLKMYCAKPKS